MKFGIESIKDAWQDGVTLMMAHNREVGSLPMENFKPNKELYLKCEEMGLLKLFTARDDFNELVGYSIFLITPHLHYSEVVWAQQDVLFVTKPHRGVTGYRFIEWVDEQLRVMGVQVIMRTVMPKKDYSPTLKRNGYEQGDTNYLRRFF